MKIIKTTTQDGLTFSGLISESPNSKKIIIHIHGMSGDIYYNCFYPFMHEYYPQNGYSFLAVEHRGTHSITQFETKNEVRNIGNAYEIFEDSVVDIQAWVKKAQDLGYQEIWLQSHSLGPSKVVFYMNTVKKFFIKGLIFLSPSDMIGLVNTPEEKSLHTKLLKEAKKLVKNNKALQLLSENLWGCYKLSAQTYLNFFGKNANTAIFNYGDSSLGWKKINSINVPVIAFTGTRDEGIVSVMDANNAMNLLKTNLVNSPRIKTVVFEGAEHSFNGFEERIVKEVIKFVKKP